jgi:uncharacterized alpha-E superfamily protein
MLSRVAERVYWFSRYVERAESTARLLKAYTTLVMDLPKGNEPGWKHLIDIMGANRSFEELYDAYDEPNTMRFLLAEPSNPGAVVSLLSQARENVRTTRDVLPGEAWEQINELALFAKESVQQGIGRRNRFNFLKNIVVRCQQITGLLAGTMSHDSTYYFARAGRNLERADMTTRIVDSAVFILMPRKNEPAEYDNILWLNVLASLSADTMDRRHVRRHVVGEEVIDYLLKDPDLPRSVAHAVSEAAVSLALLPRHDEPLCCFKKIQRRIRRVKTEPMTLSDLHALIDDLQSDFAEAHNVIGKTWFQLDSSSAPKSNQQ